MLYCNSILVWIYLKKFFGRKKMKTNSIGITTKILSILIIALLFLTSLLVFQSMRTIRGTATKAVLQMARQKLEGDISASMLYLEKMHGTLHLKEEVLVNDGNQKINDRTDIVDTISKDLGVVATIFVAEGNDFRRVITSIKKENGERATGTYLGSGSAAYKPVREGKTYIGDASILGRAFTTAYRPLLDDAGKTIGIIFVGIEMTTINDDISREVRRSLFVLAALAAIIFLISLGITGYFITQFISKPVIRMTSLLREICEDQEGMNVTTRIEVKNRDEIGQMAAFFNLTLDRLSSLLKVMKKQAGVLSEIGLDLSANMDETAASIYQISTNIQNIKTQTINQSASVIETNSTMEQITRNIEKLDENIDQQAVSVTESSSAIEEMLANIASVSNTLVENAENVRELSLVSEDGRSALTEVSANIRVIAKESEDLMEISSVISEIASQTNLLSMNAAIEAAHAGDSGRGFAVVADEIRKLAESSGSQSKTISTTLRKIIKAMTEITSATDKVLTQFEDINSRINSVSEREQGIKNAMDEQGAGSEEILKAISQLNEITSIVKASSNEMLTGSQEVIKETKNLSMISEELKGGMNEMAAGVEQITIAVHSVSEISKTNKEAIDTLMSEVGKFKVD